MDQLRAACALVAERARHVRIEKRRIPEYAASLQLDVPAVERHAEGSREHRAAFWLTLDAINFGSGWFPTLDKRPGRSGYFTIEAGLREHGPWTRGGASGDHGRRARARPWARTRTMS